MASIYTPEFRVSFPAVFRPEKNDDPTAPPKYALIMAFPKGADLSALEAAVNSAAAARWGADKKQWPSNLRMPFKNQGEKLKYDGYVDGAVYIKAKSSQKPGLVDAKLNPIIAEDEFYAGCWAIATVNVFAYPAPGAKDMGNRGVSIGLRNIQKLRDDTPFGNKTDARSDFKALDNDPFA